MKRPSECTSIEEVRASIDTIDEQIISLIGKRALYVNEVVKYKKHDKESVLAVKRQEEVLRRRRELAVQNNLDPEVIEKMYRTLIDYFVNTELKILKIE